jgi:sRNA-binding carbon storage regulator CsrA
MRICNQNSVRFSIRAPSIEAKVRQVKLQIHVPEVILLLRTENKIATAVQAFNFIRYESVASAG